MAIQIGAKPDSGFDDPIGMLKDCHRRIERFLHVLCVVPNRAAGRVLTEEEKSAVQSALQYFRSGGLRHTADEEDSLFPRLRSKVGSDSFEEIAGLEGDHRKADDLHASIDRLYMTWIASDSLNEDEFSQLRSATQQLNLLYEKHIQIEESVVFPRAAELLNCETIAAIGREFRARRS